MVAVIAPQLFGRELEVRRVEEVVGTGVAVEDDVGVTMTREVDVVVVVVVVEVEVVGWPPHSTGSCKHGIGQ